MNIKPKQKHQYHTSKPSYLLTGASSHIMKETDKILKSKQKEKSKPLSSKERFSPPKQTFIKIPSYRPLKSSQINVTLKSHPSTQNKPKKSHSTGKMPLLFKSPSLSETKPNSFKEEIPNKSNSPFLKSKSFINNDINDIKDIKPKNLKKKEISLRKDKITLANRNPKNTIFLTHNSESKRIITPKIEKKREVKSLHLTDKKTQKTLEKMKIIPFATLNVDKDKLFIKKPSQSVGGKPKANANNPIPNSKIKAKSIFPKNALNPINPLNSLNILNTSSSKKSNSKKSLISLSDLNKNLSNSSTIQPKTTASSIRQYKKVLKIDSQSIAGFSKPGIQKINQDNFFIEKNFLDDQDQFFVGVCDGHGIFGHLCSEFLSSNLPDFLAFQYKKHSLSSSSFNSIVKNSFIQFNKALVNQKEINTQFSGTTCCSAFIFQDKIISANVGDSRAILSRFENGEYTTYPLTRDHKPTEEDECKRILDKGGRVSPFYDEETYEFVGPKRIWLSDSDVPGLAMTRSFGDDLAHTLGVIAEPEMCECQFNGNEKFVIIASDGIWEFIDREECVYIVKEFYENDMDARGAVKALVSEAYRRWRREEDIVDDITAVVIFFG